METNSLGTLTLLTDLKRLIQVLGRGWRLIGAAILACLTLSAAYLQLANRTYRATARLLVLQQSERPLRVVSNTDQVRYQEEKDDYVATQAGVINSTLIVGRAIESVGLKALPSLDPRGRDKEPVELALKRLNVTRPDRTAKILLVEYRADSRTEAILFVRALIESYRQFLRQDIYQNANNQIIKLIDHSKGDLQEELEGLERKYVEFRRAHPGLMTADKQGHTVNAERLEGWSKAATDTEIKAVRVKAQLEMSRKLAGEGTGLWAIAYAISELGNGTGELIRSLDSRAMQVGGSDYLRSLVQEQQKLAEENGALSTKVVELQDRIARVQERSRGASDSDTHDLIQSMEQTLERLDTIQAEYESLFTGGLRKVSEDEIALLEEEILKSTWDRHRMLFNTVMDQLKQAQLISNYNAISFQTIEAPRSTARPISPIPGLILGLGTLGGCLLGCTAVVVADQYSMPRSPREGENQS